MNSINRSTRMQFLSGKALHIVLFLILMFLAFSSVFAQNTSVPFSFNLSTSARTSAGVFKRDGTLVRTLWNNVSYKAGTHNGLWDRKDDEGRLITDTGLVVKVVSNNVNYKWEGVIGNTSDSMTGSTVIRMFDRMHGLAIVGNNAYYGAGYTEGITSSYKFKTNDPQKKINLLYSEVQQMYQASEYVATDSNYVYWAGYDPFDPKSSFVYATKVSDDKEVTFSSGSSFNITYGRSYNSVIDLVTNNLSAICKGLAVQKKGQYLFVSHPGVNEIHVLNKTTGARVQTISMTNPRDLAVDMNDNLWVISGTTTVQKFSVNSNGTLSSATITLSGLVQPLALAVSPDNSTVVVIDGGSSQQLKAYSNSNGSSSWTFGQSGGYASDPTVANDKFYFSDDVTMLSKPYIAFQPDGSFWVGDVGNERTQHYNASRVFIDRIMCLPHSYSVAADRNNPTRVFNEYLEFQIDYSKPLSPKNGSWTLVRNWRRGVTKDYFQEGKMNIFNQVITLSNGRTYATVENAKNPDVRYPEVVELPPSGHIRYTGVRFADFGKEFIDLDGSLRKFESSGQVGDGGYWESRPLTGFSNNNPVWGTATRIGEIPTISAKDPANGQISHPVKTSSDLLVVFEKQRYNQGFHLGAVKKNDNKYLWKAAPATTRDYSGPFPSDGSFDIGNGVEYAGGHVYALEKNILWNYHGEFWKNGQTNMWNHFYDNGLMIGQFGEASYEAQKIHMEAFEMGAGNVFASTLLKYGNDYYVYHNDESVHAGVHRWKISGLNTIQEQTIAITVPNVSSGGLIGAYFNGTELDNTNLKVSQLNTTVNLSTPPSQITNTSSFSTRWTGFVKPSSAAAYTFYTNTSKGVKLWIDGNLVINQWNNSSSAQYNSSAITLEANKMYAVRMEINGGTASLSWSSPSFSKQIIPSGNLYPSDLPQYSSGIDLMEGLCGRNNILSNGMYGWNRNAPNEDSTSWDQYWRARVGVKAYGNENPDLYLTFRRTSGTYDVTRTLGNPGTGYRYWKVSGTINYDANYAKWTTDAAGTYFDVLDDQNKVITRVTHEQYLNSSLMNNMIRFNNKTVVDMVDKYLYSTINKHQPFDIIADSTGVSFRYSSFGMVKAKIFDTTSNWRKPKTIRFYFIGSSNSYDRMIDIGRLSFYATNQTINTSIPATIQVSGNNINILDGDNSPSTSDYTDFGTVQSNGSITRSFVISNTGTLPLSVTGVSFTGTNSSEFTVVNGPTYPLTIAASGSYTLNVNFFPKATGNRTATINIANSDLSKTNFNFDLQGAIASGGAPQIMVTGNGNNIIDGIGSPNTNDNTDFGSTSTYVTRTFVVKNIGNASLTISGCNITGTNASEFTLVNAPSYPLSIAPQATYDLTIRFAPAATGTRTATFNINNDDPHIATFNFDMQGTGAAGSPQISVSGNSTTIADEDASPSTADNTDFGAINNNSTVTKTFSISNTGSAALTVSNISFTGSNASEFSLVSGPSFPLSIAASSSYTITVQFAPKSTGTRLAVINISSNDAGKAVYNFNLQGTSNVVSTGNSQIMVTGNGVNIIDGIGSPNTADNTEFGTVAAGGSITKSFVIKNIGNANLVISGCNFTGTNASEFSIVSAPSYPLSIVPNAAYTMTISFAPLAAGTRNATFNINCNDPHIATFNFDISGTATAGSPKISVTGNSLTITDGSGTPNTSDNTDFGSVSSGGSITKTFVVKNTGTAALSITSISFSGSNPSEFSITSAPSYPLSLAVNATYSLSVKFTPAASGVRTATLNINSNDPSVSTYNFDIAGTCTAPSGSPQIMVTGNNVNIVDGIGTPNSSDNTLFGSVNVGSSSVKTYVIKNIGTAALTISNMYLSGSHTNQYVIVNPPSYPLSIAVSGTYTLTVKFAPGSQGKKTAAVNIACNDPHISVFNFDIEGTGVRKRTSVDDQSTAIEETDSPKVAFDFIPYPNPFNDLFHVRYDNSKSERVGYIRIINAQGAVIENKQVELSPGLNEIGIEGGSYPSGIYYLTFTVGVDKQTKMIQKLH